MLPLSILLVLLADALFVFLLQHSKWPLVTFLFYQSAKEEKGVFGTTAKKN